MLAAAAVVVAVLALAALAATIDGGDDSSSASELRADGQSGNVRGFDLGDGRTLEVRPIPGCEGGFELGDQFLVVPDPEACGFEPVPPGAFGYETSGGRTMLVPSPEGDIGGFRLGPDGLELIAPDALRAGDILFGLIPGGSIELFGPNGAPLPQTSLPQPEIDPPDTGSSGSTILLVLAIAAGLALLGVALWYWLTRRGADEEPTGPTENFAIEIGALDRLLWEIEQEPDPRAAIRRAYAALETGLGEQTLERRAHETPGVYLHRILGRFAGLDRPLRELVELFERARFSDHVITAEMRDQAVAALHRIRALLVDAGAVAAASASPDHTPVPIGTS